MWPHRGQPRKILISPVRLPLRRTRAPPQRSPIRWLASPHPSRPSPRRAPWKCCSDRARPPHLLIPSPQHLPRPPHLPPLPHRHPPAPTCRLRWSWPMPTPSLKRLLRLQLRLPFHHRSFPHRRAGAAMWRPPVAVPLRRSRQFNSTSKKKRPSNCSIRWKSCATRTNCSIISVVLRAAHGSGLRFAPGPAPLRPLAPYTNRPRLPLHTLRSARTSAWQSCCSSRSISRSWMRAASSDRRTQRPVRRISNWRRRNCCAA